MSRPQGIRLLYLRHGQTDLNLESRMQGTTDAPLNERGRRQIEGARERLAGETFAAVYASDLLRARQSAGIATGLDGNRIRLDPRIREQDLGSWEGEVWFDLPRRFSEEDFRRFMGDIDFAPPGGESRRQVRDRIRAFLDDVVAEWSAGDTVLAVSHGGPLYVLVHEILDVPYSPKKRFYGANGGLSEFVCVDGSWIMVSFNETHFQGGDRS